MQGIQTFIPTAQKAAYLNSLLQVGFDTLDFGSFVSPKAIPQLSDTAAVLEQLDVSNTRTKLLAIVANLRGGQQAVTFPEIQYLGFPLSLSETFQQRNTNKSIAEALQLVDALQELCQKKAKELVVYLSMGFGNPYGDPYDVGVVQEFVGKMYAKGVKIISLSDTIASASPGLVRSLFEQIQGQFKGLEIGVHLHTQRHNAYEKINAAYEGGCRRFDGALLGYGGCPMAKNELTGNLPTEEIVRYINDNQLPSTLDGAALKKALQLANTVF